MRTMQREAELVSLGALIRERRRAMGLTQAQLGERVGYVQERISLLEGGKYGMPSLPALVSLAGALDLPLSAVLRALGFEEEAAIVEESPPGQSGGDASLSEVNANRLALRHLEAQNARLVQNIDDLCNRLADSADRMQEAFSLQSRLRANRLQMQEAMESLRPPQALT